MFGGSTLVLFLLCYCCQRKLRPHDTTSENLQQVTTNHTMYQEEIIHRDIENQVTITDSSLPPPPYDIVIKSKMDQNPPGYNEVISSFPTSNYI